MSKLIVSRRSALALGAGAAVGIASPAIAQSRQRLTVATGGTGGVFFPYGGGIARILTEKMPNTQATGQVTGGSVDNVKLLHQGDADIGFSTLDSAYDGLNGQGAYARDGKQDVRVLAVLYDSFLHVVADGRIAELSSIAGMRGRRISVGSAGSSTESIADRVLEAAGLNPQRDISRDNLGVAESAGALKDGKVAAFFWIGGVPTAAVRDLATSGSPPLRFVPTGVEMQELERRFPGQYRSIVLAANAYAGQTAAVPCLGVANVLLVSANARAAMVTQVLTTLFDNLADVQAIHPEARRLTLAGAATKSAVPFHPAAEAFYRSRGIQL
ncbi:MAG: TAXI family TRAP transporter solute-binding subunit [Alphaproteobacteria bacterium]|nr:TAXI family TRAP transporter solute-binding subunit [Alphaproteobacteria bacterium]